MRTEELRRICSIFEAQVRCEIPEATFKNIVSFSYNTRGDK